MKVIKYNIKEIAKTSFCVASTLFSILSFVLITITWEDLEKIGMPDKLHTILLFLLISILTGILWICVFLRKQTIYEKGTGKIQICYGDIIKLGFTKKN